ILEVGKVIKDGEHERNEQLNEFDIPTAFELVEKKNGPEIWETPEGKALEIIADSYRMLNTISLPPPTKSQIVEVLKNAVNEMCNDNKFQDESKEISGRDIIFMDGEESQELVNNVTKKLEETPEIREIINENIKE